MDKETASRHTGSRQATNTLHSDVSYRRLECLYKISQSLASFDGVTEAFQEILTFVDSVFPLSSAALIERRDHTSHTYIWPLTSINDEKMKITVESLKTTYGYMVNASSRELEELRTKPATTTTLRGKAQPNEPGAEGQDADTDLIFPLVVARSPIFGVFQLVAKDRLGEKDVHFGNAVANLIAVAFDRFRRAEDRQSELLGAILDSLVDGMVACNADGILTTFNESAGRIYGPVEVGSSLSEWSSSFPRYRSDGITPLKSEELPLYRTLHEGSIEPVEVVVKPEGQSSRTLRCQGRAIYDKEGRKIGAVVVYHDAGAEKEAQALTGLRNELMRSNVELKNFSSTAAHDLSAPLNSISQFIELLAEDLEGQLGSDSKEYMGFISGAADRMRTLISRLLTYAQVGAKREPYKPVDCNLLVDQILKDLHAATTSSHAIVKRGHLPVVVGNSGELAQLFQNLISNSIKFAAKDRDPEVQISAENTVDSFVQFSVVDNGVGVASRYAAQIFEPFERFHGTKYEGSGLGLAIAKKIVTSHGGTIWMESEIDKGAAIHFTLPRFQGKQ